MTLPKQSLPLKRNQPSDEFINDAENKKGINNQDNLKKEEKASLLNPSPPSSLFSSSSQRTASNPKGPQETKRSKFIYILLGLIILVLIGEGVYYYFTFYRKTPENPADELSTSQPPADGSLPTELPAGELANSEISKKVLEWLNQQRDERGVYHITRFCRADGDCSKVLPSGTSGHYGLAAIWGRFKYYQNTQEAKDLEIINQDLAIYNDEEKVDSIQNDFWNCKLMFEMWQSDLFEESQKEKIKNICFRGTSTYYHPPDLEEIIRLEVVDNRWQEVVYDEVEVMEIEEIIKGNKDNIFFETPLSEEDKNENMVVFYTSAPAEFLSRYFWEKNENDLLKAKFFFNKSLQLYLEEDRLLGEKERCLLGISSLDFFKLSKDQKYLDFSERLFDELSAKSNRLKPPVCGIFANDLFKATGDKKYQEEKEKILGLLIDNAFDFIGYGGYLNGDGSFRSIDAEGKVGIEKETRENGLMVGILNE